MKLLIQQKEFAYELGQLINFVRLQGRIITLGESYRTPEQAAIYAKEKKGIKDSLHCKKLAIDINLFDEHGNYLQDTKEYKFMGDYWKKLSPLNRWGGEFTRADGNHFEKRLDE